VTKSFFGAKMVAGHTNQETTDNTKLKSTHREHTKQSHPRKQKKKAPPPAQSIWTTTAAK